MNCDEFRERILIAGSDSPRVPHDEHLATCPECAAWYSMETAVMTKLSQAGEHWRNAPLADQVMNTLGERTTSSPAHPRHRTPLAKFAVAAALVLAAGAALVFSLTPAPASAMSAMSAMAEQLKNAGSVAFTMESPARTPPSCRMTVRGQDMRAELATGEIIIANATRNELVVLRPDRREFMRGEPSQRPFDLRAAFIELAQAPRIESLGREQLIGRSAEVFRAHMPKSFDGMPDAVAKIWLDVATHKPLRIEIPLLTLDGPKMVTFKDFAFDDAVSEALFDTAPPGYTRAEPQADTPGVGNQIGIKMRNLGMAFHAFLSQHDDQPPATIEDLKPLVPEGGLVNPRRPSEPIGFVYVKPVMPLKYDDLLLYERFAENADKIWIARVDSSVHMLTRAEFDKLIAERAKE